MLFSIVGVLYINKSNITKPTNYISLASMKTPPPRIHDIQWIYLLRPCFFEIDGQPSTHLHYSMRISPSMRINPLAFAKKNVITRFNQGPSARKAGIIWH